jgi:hypothetical protein
VNRKAMLTYVLMIDLDWPNVDMAIRFFQTYFNGQHPKSPIGINHLFLPLFRKSDADKQKQSIIDNDHHTKNVNIVVLQGLNHLETIIVLTNGVHTRICKLLFPIPEAGTTMEKLFVRIEHHRQSITGSSVASILLMHTRSCFILVV